MGRTYSPAAPALLPLSPWEQLLAFSVLTKVLLWHAYQSTDFEVHRNWLALTHQLPMAQWYEEATSKWTLDYPPLFAWFEWLLSQAAPWVDPGMLSITATAYTSWACTIFQRFTVVLTELVLWYALTQLRKVPMLRSSALVLGALTLLNPGLYIVDHIHFQYNGMLYGLLLLSLGHVLQGNDWWGGVFFAILLNFKHIYAYVAPAYFIYFLSGYCLAQSRNEQGCYEWPRVVKRLVALGSGVIAVFAVSLGPFAYYGQLPQLLARLFPFKRGLCHALWAPNAWALYSTLDRVLIKAWQVYGWPVDATAALTTTRGLVGNTQFGVLPNISPLTTFVLTVLAQLPALVGLFQHPTRAHLVRVLVLAALTSFLFGWHVHEKAIMLVSIPMALLLGPNEPTTNRLYYLLNVAGSNALLPLLHEPMETPLKLIIFALWAVVAFFCLGLGRECSGQAMGKLPWPVYAIRCLELGYVLGFPVLQLYTSVVHPLLPLHQQALQFLPLLLTACYSAIGVVYVWISYYYWLLTTTCLD
ncbi:glycosyl transferase [Dimargaris verticillata]|uniref:Alpha-1,3-glucosyltransferase n=1 Tax=Dimargaris verticillata TaxID=2761393 RepID=A0A9W8BDF0_9FUNG|nr:glycosyl transferase [Dimargaris verticillata]